MTSSYFFAAIGLLLCTSVDGFEYKINVNVIGYPGSSDTELYKLIAEVLFNETHYNSSQKANCAIYFNNLTYDSSNGSTIYKSLTTARNSFSALDVAVAVGPFIDVFASTDYVILNQLHLLTSPAGENAGLMDPAKVVSILPEPYSLATAIADVILKLKWKDVVLLSQDDFSLVLTLGKRGINVWPIRLPTRIVSHEDPELQKNLIELRASEKNKFILHSTRRSTVQHVMMAANRLHLLHHSIEWFITYPDFQDVIQGDSGKWPDSLYGLQLLQADRIKYNLTELLELNMSRLELGLALDVVGLLQQVLWLSSGNCSRPAAGSHHVITATEFKHIFKSKQMIFSGALGEYVWEGNNNTRTNYTMDVLAYKDDYYKIGKVSFVNGEPVLEMTRSMDEPKNNQKPKNISVFGKDAVRIVIKQDDPFIIKNGHDSYSGFSYDLLLKLASKLNFSFKLFDISDWHYANHSDFGDGMVEELIAGNASMAVGALEVTAKREEKISFSYTILSTHASILIKKEKSTQNFFQFLSPFKTSLWMMILAFVAMAAAALFLISRFDPTQQDVEQKFDLKESTWYALNILLQGTTEYSPQTTSMRAIIAFFWFSVLIIDAAYTANLAAYLTLQQIDYRIRSVHDLSRQTQIKYGVQHDSSLMRFFEEQKEDPYERMWAFMKINEESSLLNNTKDILDKIYSGRFVFIADSVKNAYYANQYCGIESIDQNFGAKDFGLGFPRGAPYRDDINRALLELKEQGIMDELHNKWWKAGQNCTEDDKTRSVTDKTTAELGIVNTVGVFIVLAVFSVLAVVVHVSQRFFLKANEKNKSNLSGDVRPGENHVKK